MKKEQIDYQSENVNLRGYVAYDDKSQSKRPAVLIVHDWGGRGAFPCQKADELAAEGLVGFAVDMFGDARTGKTKEEKSALMQPLTQDRAKVLSRMKAALEKVKSLPVVDANKITAIGFCFGGLCALDLARGGADLKAVVSFHGNLTPPGHPNKTIKAKLLILHGYDDPMVPPDQVLAFANEMTKSQADWQIHMFSQSKHAFTNPEANDPSFGTVYNPQTATRAFTEMHTFFKELGIL